MRKEDSKFDMEEALRLYPPGKQAAQEKIGQGKIVQARMDQVKIDTDSPLDMESLLQKYSPDSKDLQVKNSEKAPAQRVNWRNKLRHSRVDETIDLHHLYRAEAESRLKDFLERARSNGMRKICIIHGKGHHSKDENKGILQKLVREFLQEAKNAGLIQDFCHPPEREGGRGASIAIIR